jgi:hypothetical protein
MTDQAQKARVVTYRGEDREVPPSLGDHVHKDANRGLYPQNPQNFPVGYVSV